jgi:hypothetical protein
VTGPRRRLNNSAPPPAPTITEGENPIMATSKKTTTKATVAPPPPTAIEERASKAIKQAVSRAVNARQFSPKIKGPIFVGIWFNPATKEFEVVNQFE